MKLISQIIYVVARESIDPYKACFIRSFRTKVAAATFSKKFFHFFLVMIFNILNGNVVRRMTICITLLIFVVVK